MPISSRHLLAAGLCLVLLGGCTGEHDASTAVAEDFGCTRADIPRDFVLLVTGDFTPGNLAEVTTAPAPRAQALRASGLEGGQFSYWKQTVEKPPFDPPANILCEVLQFETAAGAASYIDSLDPGRAGSLPGFAWLPDGPRSIEDAGGEPGSRAFRLEAVGDDVTVHLAIVFAQHDTRVITVYAGGQRAEDELERARAIQARLLQRVSGGSAAASSEATCCSPR
jgi:hypothetical protein